MKVTVVGAGYVAATVLPAGRETPPTWPRPYRKSPPTPRSGRKWPGRRQYACERSWEGLLQSLLDSYRTIAGAAGGLKKAI